jgi:hypothetical protein
LSPKDGRRRPGNGKPNDIFYWNTILVTSDFDSILSKLDRENVPYLSSKVISLSKEENDSSRAVLIADPDGHGILLTEEAGMN